MNQLYWLIYLMTNIGEHSREICNRNWDPFVFANWVCQLLVFRLSTQTWMTPVCTNAKCPTTTIRRRSWKCHFHWKFWVQRHKQFRWNKQMVYNKPFLKSCARSNRNISESRAYIVGSHDLYMKEASEVSKLVLKYNILSFLRQLKNWSLIWMKYYILCYISLTKKNRSKIRIYEHFLKYNHVYKIK